jgi:hypothetical protein
LLDSPQSSRDLMFECRLANVGRHVVECTVGLGGSDRALR